MGWFTCYCKEDENIFLYPSRKNSLSAGYFQSDGPFPTACMVEFILFGTHRTGEVQAY
jgi:hypothetical protein